MIRKGDKIIIKDNIVEERLKNGKASYANLLTKYIGKEVIAWDVGDNFIGISIEKCSIVLPMSAVTTISEIRAIKIQSLNLL